MPLDEYKFGRREPAWIWWTPGEPEDGLSGFDTQECRDAFSAGGSGPFKRRIATGGMRCTPQMPMRAIKDKERD